MSIAVRQWLNRLFTIAALLSVVFIVAALVGILLPMVWRGGGAVVFRGTVEFRKMQLEQFGRGDTKAVRAEWEQAARLRQRAWDILDRFAAGLDTSDLQIKVRRIHRDLGDQLANRDLPRQELAHLRALSRQFRDDLLAALESGDKAQALARLQSVLDHADDPLLADTLAAGYFEVARRYEKTLVTVDLSRRAEYAQGIGEIRAILQNLLGPRPGERLPAIVMEQYGATRWDHAAQHLNRLLWAERWAPAGPGQPLRRVQVPREQQFAGTELAKLFPFVRDNIREMLRPRWTVYWHYFTDDSTPGHYFGGVGPEILGTLLVTVLAIAFALPIGVITAGYLVECAADTLPTRMLRMAVNTLAGVPSIVFGLFGLAFFVIYLLPKLGLPEGSSIVAGALTLGLLVLPVVIRASEEAIRAVPQAYREAALSLGASRFRCFITVLLPAALPGVLTGLILSMSRAAGETAPILFTAAVAMGPIPSSLAQPTRTLAYSSYDMAVGDKMAAMAPHNQFGMVATLIAIVLLLNAAAIVLRGRISKRLRGQ